MKLFHLTALGIAIGLLAAILSIPQNPIIRERIESTIRQLFEDAFDCVVADGQLTSVNLLGIDLLARNILVQDKKGQWFWQAEKAAIHISWVDFLATNKCNLEVFLQGMRTYSRADQHEIAIWQHIKHMIADPGGLPIDLKTLIIRKAHGVVDYGTVKGEFNFATEIRNKPDQIKIRVYLDTGCCSTKNKCVYMPRFKLRYEKNKAEISGSAQGLLCFDEAGGAEQHFLLQADLFNQTGLFDLHSKDQSTFIKTTNCSINQQGFCADLTGHISSTIFMSIFPQLARLRGTHEINAHLALDENFFFNAAIQSPDMTYANFNLGTMTNTITYAANAWQGNCTNNIPTLGTVSAQWFCKQNQFDCTIKNDDTLNNLCGAWTIGPGNSSLRVHIDQSGIAGDCCLHAIHPKLNELSISQLQFAYDHNGLKVTGKHNDQTLTVNADAACNVQKAELLDAQNNMIGAIDAIAQNQWRAQLDLAKLQPLLQKIINTNVQTEGMLHAEINKTYETFNASVQLQKGIIHYVSSYNFIKDITAHILFDPPTLKVDIDSAVLALHKGAMRIDKGTIAWDALAIKPFVHIPLLIDNFFVNYDKNIFAVFSGGLLCYNTQDGLQISGKTKFTTKYHACSSSC
jgi:hypothetical protein